MVLEGVLQDPSTLELDLKYGISTTVGTEKTHPKREEVSLDYAPTHAPRRQRNLRHGRMSQARTEPAWLHCALLRLLALIGAGWETEP